MVLNNPKIQTHEKINHRLFSQTQIELIERLHTPIVVRFMLASEFETKFINSSSNIWSFYYSGKKEYINFDEKNYLDKHEIKLLKHFLVYYSQINSPSNLSRHFKQIRSILINLMKNNESFAYESLEKVLLSLAKDSTKHRVYYTLKNFIRFLIVEGFEKFTEEDELKLLILERPLNMNSQLLYQEAEDLISSSTITMIQNGFAKLNFKIVQNKIISDEVITNASILGLVYATGMRPVQLSKLSVDNIKVDTQSDKGAMRYSILVPYAKQGRFNHNEVAIKLPEEIAIVITQYIKQLKLQNGQQLFNLGDDAVTYCNKAINKQLFEFSPDEYKRKITNGELIQIKYTSNQFRHHVAHSMALSGASAEDIAYILGHSSLVTARHYIYSSPNLAQIRALALGRNRVYKQMIAMLMTGDIINQEDNIGENIEGFIEGTIHNHIGRCAYDEACFLAPVRSCYGCIYFHPYINGKHEQVLKCIQKELEAILHISDAVHNSFNPIINVHEATKFEIESVIKRCELNREVENADQ